MTHAGGFVYWRGNAKRRLLWVDRSGAPRPAIEAPHEFDFVRLSPDGRRAAVNIVTGAKYDVWTADLSSGTISPLTSTGTVRNPVWSPDGTRLLYVSTQGGRAQLWWQPSDGSGPPVLAGDPRRNAWMLDLASDGKTVVYNTISDGTFNLETFALAGEGGARALADSRQAWETFGRFSPDARWVAYESDESGRGEIYLRTLAEGGGRLQVSANGGQRPV